MATHEEEIKCKLFINQTFISGKVEFSAFFLEIFYSKYRLFLFLLSAV